MQNKGFSAIRPHEYIGQIKLSNLGINKLPLINGVQATSKSKINAIYYPL